MAKGDAADTIRELEAAIEFLRDRSNAELDRIEKANPQLGEADLFQHYKGEITKALDGLRPETVAAIATGSFLELRRKRSGYNPDHVGGG